MKLLEEWIEVLCAESMPVRKVEGHVAGGWESVAALPNERTILRLNLVKYGRSESTPEDDGRSSMKDAWQGTYDQEIGLVAGTHECLDLAFCRSL